MISEHLINNLNYQRPRLNGLFLYFVECLIISIILINHFLIINKHRMTNITLPFQLSFKSP